jgi:hypothetical protein
MSLFFIAEILVHRQSYLLLRNPHPCICAKWHYLRDADLCEKILTNNPKIFYLTKRHKQYKKNSNLFLSLLPKLGQNKIHENQLRRIDNKPLFTSDELVHYETILRENFSTKAPFEPTGKRGRPKKVK